MRLGGTHKRRVRSLHDERTTWHRPDVQGSRTRENVARPPAAAEQDPRQIENCKSASQQNNARIRKKGMAITKYKEAIEHGRWNHGVFQDW